MILNVIEWFVDATRKTKLVVAIVLVAALGTGGITYLALRPHRSVEVFCQTYQDEKSKYLKATDVSDSSSGAQVFGGLSAVLTIPEMFDRLDRVAPADIEPDVRKIRDSLDKARERAGASAGDPLTGLAATFVTGLEIGPSWEAVGRYVDSNCPKTAAEQAAIQVAATASAQAQASAAAASSAADREQQKQELQSAASDLKSDVDNVDAAHAKKPLGLTDDLDARVQELKAAIIEARHTALEPNSSKGRVADLPPSPSRAAVKTAAFLRNLADSTLRCPASCSIDSGEIVA